MASAPRPLPPLAGLWSTAVMVAVVAVALALRPFVDDYAVQIGYRLLLYCALGEAWNLLAGYGGLVSLGSASFVGAGAYVAVELLNGPVTSFTVALVAAGLVAAALAAVVAPAVFRMRGLYFTIGTLALGEALRLFMVNVPWFGGATGLFLSTDLPEAGTLYVYAAALLLIATLTVSAYTTTRLSVTLRAVRDDEMAAMQVGVRAFRVKFAAFVVSSTLMGIAGGIQGLRVGAIEPYGMFGLQWSVDVLILVIVGGMGMRLGPLVGAVFSVGLAELLSGYPNIHIAITGVILIVVIRFAPRGLCGLAARAWAAWRTPAPGIAPAPD